MSEAATAAPPAADMLAGTTPASTTAPAAAPAADPREWLPEEFRNDSAFEPFKDISALAKSYRDTAKMVGVDKNTLLRLPKDPDAPEWADVWAKLGRPEAPDGYKIEGEHGLTEDQVAAFRAQAHAMGLPQRQAEGMVQFYAQQQQAARTALQTQAVSALTEEWGAAFDDRVGAARKAAELYGGPELMQVLKDTGLGFHPAVVRAFAKIGMETSEPGELRGGGGGRPTGGRLTPADARSEIGKLYQDPNFTAAYYNRDHAGHAEAVRRMEVLAEQAHPPTG
jgi:hypothetical protein